jgi:hypothetical protein
MNSVATIQPRQRTILAVDIEGSTERNNSARAKLRDDMYALLEQALLDSGITEDLREPFLDRGDGAIALIHPADTVPKTILLSTFIPLLSEQLAKHGMTADGFRLRAAVHAGHVHSDQRGMFGEDIDVTMRLLDSPELKARLRRSSAPLVLVVSDYIYRSVIRHGYDGIDERTFAPLVHLRVGGLSYQGWVQIPGEVVWIDQVS